MANGPVRPLVLALCLSCLAVSGAAERHPQDTASPDLRAHEWGTFTSVAGRSGQAVGWSPLGGSSDLPSFVEHFRSADFKIQLRGTVRMETPVLYFYSPRAMNVSVNVGFPHGLITEWYPHATRTEPRAEAQLDNDALYKHHYRAGIAWDSVDLAPDTMENFAAGEPGSRYYAARETSATPLSVKTAKGTQFEKFLFYRGVANFKPPVAASVTPDGKIAVRNLTAYAVPAVLLVERRGDRFGYRLAGGVEKDAVLDQPDLGPISDQAMSDLESVLEAQGLYLDEARAMIKTWADSWQEEGSRLFYIVPRSVVDEILPLRIEPRPVQTVRVFVGRVELITPATEKAVETALANHDRDTIDMYGRFLEPIMEQLKAENPGRAQELEKELMATWNVQPRARNRN